jgi:hypothetical protein
MDPLSRRGARAEKPLSVVDVVVMPAVVVVPMVVVMAAMGMMSNRNLLDRHGGRNRWCDDSRADGDRSQKEPRHDQGG